MLPFSLPNVTTGGAEKVKHRLFYSYDVNVANDSIKTFAGILIYS